MFGVFAASSANIIDIYENAAGVAVSTGRSYPAASMFQETLQQHMARETTPIAGTQMDNKTYCIHKPADHAGLIKALKFHSQVTGTVELKVWSVAGTVYTQTAERTVTVLATGLQAFSDADLSGLSVNVGDVIAVKGSVTGVMGYTANITDGDCYFAVAGDASGARQLDTHRHQPNHPHCAAQQ